MLKSCNCNIFSVFVKFQRNTMRDKRAAICSTRFYNARVPRGAQMCGEFAKFREREIDTLSNNVDSS